MRNTAHTMSHVPGVVLSPATHAPSLAEQRTHALMRAELGWTRNEATHSTLEVLERTGLVAHIMSELRQALPADSERLKTVWAGSKWEITPMGRAELARLRRLHPSVTADELATWEPAAVAKSERVARGIYNVVLVNKARATVAKASEITSGVARRGWYWIDRRGGVEGFDTKGEALESFRKYRG
jgi:hypothetical protein